MSVASFRGTVKNLTYVSLHLRGVRNEKDFSCLASVNEPSKLARKMSLNFGRVMLLR